MAPPRRSAYASRLPVGALEGLQLVNFIRAVLGLERIDGGKREDVKGLRVFAGIPRTYNELGARLAARRTGR